MFTNQPNLNRILLTRMENIGDREVEELEREQLKKCIAGGKLRVFLWTTDILDTTDIKLVILKEPDDALMKQTLEMRGNTPRVNRNTLFFLTPLESERTGFHNLLKKRIAYQQIGGDGTLNLSGDQRKEITTELRKIEEGLPEALRRYYRSLFLPARDGLKEQDLGIPTYGEEKKIDEEVYGKLRSDGEVLERIVPLVIKERYLKHTQYALTEQLAQSSARTPGEVRVISREVWERGIAEGVRQGLFGLGELEDGKPVCRFFKKDTSVALSGDEVIIREDLCRSCGEEPSPEVIYPPGGGEGGKKDLEVDDGDTPPVIIPPPKDKGEGRKSIRLRFILPRGKVSSLMGVMNLLQKKFTKLEVELLAKDGEMSEQDYEDKVKEAFHQLGIELEE